MKKTFLFAVLTISLNYYLPAQDPGVAEEIERFGLKSIEKEGITEFFVAQLENGVEIKWQPRQETGKTIYFIQRSSDNSIYRNIGYKEFSNEQPGDEKLYSFADKTGSGRYYYRILKINADGSYYVTQKIKTGQQENWVLSVYP